MQPKEKSVDPLYVTVIGGGSFGTVLANLCATNGHYTMQWMRCNEQVKEMNTKHTNHRYLSDFNIHPQVYATSDIDEAIESAHIIFIAIPSQSFRSVVKKLKNKVRNKVIISTVKGIEASSFSLMTEIIQEELPGSLFGAMGGPNLASEIADKKVTATVIGSKNQHVCDLAQKALYCSYFRVYTSDDPYGVQLGGALKNIYAIAVGMISAKGIGENTRSLLITRSLTEMSQFAVSMGANPMTFLGLAGVGDLIVTCSSLLSRNFKIGQALGLGLSINEAQKELHQTAEGIYTISLVKNKAVQKNIEMPILFSLYSILFEGHPTHELLKNSLLHFNNTEFTYSTP